MIRNYCNHIPPNVSKPHSTKANHNCQPQDPESTVSDPALLLSHKPHICFKIWISYFGHTFATMHHNTDLVYLVLNSYGTKGYSKWAANFSQTWQMIYSLNVLAYLASLGMEVSLKNYLDLLEVPLEKIFDMRAVSAFSKLLQPCLLLKGSLLR